MLTRFSISHHIGALVYLDPPHFRGESDYGAGMFDRDDFARLAEQLSAIAGWFVLLFNDAPEMREVFGRFAIEGVETTYTLCTRTSGGGQRAGELIVMGIGGFRLVLSGILSVVGDRVRIVPAACERTTI